MVTICYSNQQVSNRDKNHCQIHPQKTSGTYSREDDVFGYKLKLLLSGVPPNGKSLSWIGLHGSGGAVLWAW